MCVILSPSLKKIKVPGAPGLLMSKIAKVNPGVSNSPHFIIIEVNITE